jgi:hypothetical protein
MKFNWLLLRYYLKKFHMVLVDTETLTDMVHMETVDTVHTETVDTVHTATVDTVHMVLVDTVHMVTVTCY